MVVDLNNPEQTKKLYGEMVCWLRELTSAYRVLHGKKLQDIIPSNCSDGGESLTALLTGRDVGVRGKELDALLNSLSIKGNFVYRFMERKGYRAEDMAGLGSSLLDVFYKESTNKWIAEHQEA